MILMNLLLSLVANACVEIPMPENSFVGRYLRIGGNGGVMIATEKEGNNTSFVYKYDKAKGTFKKYESSALYEGYPLHKSAEKCGDFEEFVSPKRESGQLGACVYSIEDVVKKNVLAQPKTCNEQTGQWYLSTVPEKECKPGCKCYSIMEFEPNFQSFGWCKEGEKLKDYKGGKRHSFVEGECLPKGFSSFEEVSAHIEKLEEEEEDLLSGGDFDGAERKRQEVESIQQRPTRPVYSKDPKFFSAVIGTTKIYEISENAGKKTCKEVYDLGITTSKAEFSYDNRKLAFTQPALEVDTRGEEYIEGNENGYTGDRVYIYDLDAPEKGPQSFKRDDEKTVAYPAFLCNGNLMYIATLESGKQVARIIDPKKPEEACKSSKDPFATDEETATGTK